MCKEAENMDLGKIFLSAAGESGTVTAVRALCGIIGILLLVYLMAELTPKLARFIDRHFGGEKTPEPPKAEDEYKVYDPYEGQTDRDDKNEK